MYVNLQGWDGTSCRGRFVNDDQHSATVYIVSEFIV